MKMDIEYFGVLVFLCFSELSLVQNKEGLRLTKTHTHPERTQGRTTSQANLVRKKEKKKYIVALYCTISE